LRLGLSAMGVAESGVVSDGGGTLIERVEASGGFRIAMKEIPVDPDGGGVETAIRSFATVNGLVSTSAFGPVEDVADIFSGEFRSAVGGGDDCRGR
jgi:hypothetical protein